jgi:hypothetical protein
LPGTEPALQKWKLGLPGSPIGQQQGVARKVCFGGDMIGRKAGAGPPIEADKGGKVGPCARRGACGRGEALPSAPRRIGDGRGGKFSRCALPTTAFLETLSRRPISAVERPSTQSTRSLAIISSDHSIL